MNGAKPPIGDFSNGLHEKVIESRALEVVRF
jgi:hypothetical protein